MNESRRVNEKRTNTEEKRISLQVVKILERFHEYRIRLDSNQMPAVVAQYKLTMASSSIGNGSKTESHIETKLMMQRFCNTVAESVNRLEEHERLILVSFYLDTARMPDCLLMEKLHLSRRTYYRKKSKAIYNLGVSLGLVDTQKIEFNGMDLVQMIQ